MTATTPDAKSPPAGSTAVVSGNPSRTIRPPRLAIPIGRIHWMGIGTLIKRHLVSFFKFWPMTLIGPGLAILLYLTIFMLALGPARELEEGAALLPFIGPGLIMLALIQRAAETSTYSMMLSKMEGSISDILMSPLSPGELTAGYALSGMLCGLLGAAAPALVILPLTGTGLASPLGAAIIAALGALAFGSVGAIIGIWAKKWDHVAAIFAFLIVPVTFISGVFAPISRLPEWLGASMAFNPIYYIIHGFREAITTGIGSDVIAAMAILTTVNLVLAAILYVLFRTGWSLRP